jgi:hypothetical protein
MAVFEITYDLLNSRQNYDGLYELLRTWNAVQALLSVWLIESNLTAEQIRDAMTAKVDSNDRILVIEITFNTRWGYKDLMPSAGQWLTDHRP